MSAGRDEALEYLQRNWGDAYEVGWGEAGVWRAVRLDNRLPLVALDADELRALIIEDYSARPVKRDGGGR